MIDLERRKRVMGRSIALGHCICDARKPCPCDNLKTKNLCLCAGEHQESPKGPVRLTQLVEKAGCASKIDQAFLKAALKDLPFIDDPRVLIGAPAGDDAGVYKITDNLALVQTVDVFTPAVDDPYTFGQIAAANSVSDIYAMGGSPITALSVIGFPARTIDDNVMRNILLGGIDKMNEAGVAILGGHSINDSQIKAGFAVTGLIDPAQTVTNANAQPGDVLILTKPLGTGIISFASQIGRASQVSIDAAAKSMTSLNKIACELMLEAGVHAATDVTGFSLLGHLGEMARLSGVNVEIMFDDVPLFPGVLEAVGQGIIPGAIERNKESCTGKIIAGDSVVQEMVDICFDAQTSGGLLICVPSRNASALLENLHTRGIQCATVIGHVLKKGTGLVHIETAGRRAIPISAKPLAAGTQQTPQIKISLSPSAQESCCASGTLAASDNTPTANQFMSFIKSANAPGALDAHTKQALAVALSVLSKCEPCLKMHIKKALAMGFSPEEIDEAAWMAIAFGGSPTMMFYNDIKRQLQ